MNRAAFRRFEFFETEVLAKDIVQKFGAIPTCSVAETGMLIFGDEFGNIIISDRDFQSTDRKHKAFNGAVLGLSYIFDKTNNNRQFIIALGDDSRPVETLDGTVANPTPIYMIKVFNTSDMNRTLYKVNATIAEGDVTAFGVLHDGTEIAVGYSNGKILLFSGFFLREAQQRPNLSPAVLLNSHFAPVSALYFCEIGAGYGEDRKIKLFSVFQTKEATFEESQQPAVDTLIEQEDIQHAGIIVFDTSISVNSVKGSVIFAPREDPKALDARGSASLCVSFMKATSELVVARNEAIYTYTIEDRGGALAIFGEKQSMLTIGRYTLVVSMDDKPAMTGNADTSTKSGRSIVTVYDLKNKFICGTSKKYYLPATERVVSVFSDNGIGYLLTSTWNLIRFREKDVHRKLDVLLHQVKPPLYPLAITLAGEEQLEASEIMKLYKLYGDYLYSKHEFDAAIYQYCYTIGFIPPSYVIVKFLDPYRIKNLITYLEKLQEKHLAMMDHITLLLNCYVKVKEENKVKELLDYIFSQTMKARLRNSEAGGEESKETSKPLLTTFANPSTFANDPNQMFIDPEQAIVILSNAGFEDYALKVAVVYMQHNSYFKIQLGKATPKYDEALGYLCYMGYTCHPSEVLHILHLYGKQLLTNRQKQYTTLLIKLCTNDLESIINLPVPSSTTPTVTSSAMKKTNTATTASASGEPHPWSTDFLVALQSFLKANPAIPADPIASEEIIKYFYDDDIHLLLFLEGLIQASKGRVLPAKIWMTYLELNMKKYHFYVLEKFKYSKQLASTASTATAAITTITNKITEYSSLMIPLENLLMNILDGANVHYDPAHVLLLCHSYGFYRGERYLLDRQQCIDLLLQQLMEKNETKEVLKLLRKEGMKEPELFIQVLTYLVQRTMTSSPSAQEKTSATTGKAKKGGAAKAKAEAASIPVRKISKDRNVQIDSDDDSYDSDGVPTTHGNREADERDDRDEDDEVEEEDENDDAKWDAVIDMMELIEKENILSPTQVLEIVTLNPALPLRVISHYMTSVLTDLKDQVSHVTNDVKKAVINLQSVSFSANAENQLKAKTKRALARAQRKNRLGYDEYDDEDEEDDLEDEKAAEQLEKEKWKSILKNQKAAALEHENFYKELELSTDGFTTVANYIGKTVIF